MANTYSKIYLHLVFVVQFRDKLLRDDFREDLQKYITKIIQSRNHKLIAINSVSDHMHILIGYYPDDKLPDLVRTVKRDSTIFINEKKFYRGKFNWQIGYGAFSYSRSQINGVAKYIDNQQEHHKTISLKDEYISILKKFDVNYSDKYLFHFELFEAKN